LSQISKKMYPAKILVTALSLVCINVFLAQAQSDSIRVRVFSEPSHDNTEAPLPEDRNYIAINPWYLARGAFTVAYEEVLQEKHALVVTGGLTYRDFMYEFLGNDFGGADEGEVEGVTVRIGTLYDIAYKFYPNGYNDFDGIYVSPGIVGRSYKTSKTVTYYNSSGDEVSADVNTSYKMNEAYIKFGYISESWLIDGMITDIYFGVGMRKIFSHSYELEDNSTGSGQFLSMGNKTKQSPCLYLGVKIGFSW
jgi:hypothetical protein